MTAQPLDPKALEAACDSYQDAVLRGCSEKVSVKAAISTYLQAAGDGWQAIESAPKFSKFSKITRDRVFLLAYLDGDGSERTSEAGWCDEWPYPRLVSDGSVVKTGYAVFPSPSQPPAPSQGDGA